MKQAKSWIKLSIHAIELLNEPLGQLGKYTGLVLVSAGVISGRLS